MWGQIYVFRFPSLKMYFFNIKVNINEENKQNVNENIYVIKLLYINDSFYFKNCSVTIYYYTFHINTSFHIIVSYKIYIFLTLNITNTYLLIFENILK